MRREKSLKEDVYVAKRYEYEYELLLLLLRWAYLKETSA